MGSKDIKHLPIKTIVAPKTKYAVVDLSKLSVTTLQNFAKSILPFLIQKGVKVSPPATIQDIYLLKAGDNMEGDLGVFNIVFEDGTIQVSLKGTETAEDPDNKIAISVALAEELYGGGDIVADSLAFTSNLAIIITSFGISLTPSDPNNKVGLTRALGDELYSHLADPSPTPLDVGFVSAPTIRGNALKVPLDAPGMYTYASWEQCLDYFVPNIGGTFTGAVTFDSGINTVTITIAGKLITTITGMGNELLTATECDTRYLGGGGDVVTVIKHLATNMDAETSPFMWVDDAGDIYQALHRPSSGKDYTTSAFFKVFTAVGIKFKNCECIGGDSYAAIGDDGKLYTWGDNRFGQLGHGDLVTRAYPTKVQFFEDNSLEIVEIKGNMFNARYNSVDDNISFITAYFLTSTGILYACGNNDRGSIGDGSLVSKSLPTQCGDGIIPNVSKFDVFGLYAFVIAFDNNGNGYVWGDNAQGQLGRGTDSDNVPTPEATIITGITNVFAVGVNTRHTNSETIGQHFGQIFIIYGAGLIVASGYNGNNSLGVGGSTEDTIVNTFTMIAVPSQCLQVGGNGINTFFLNDLNILYACGKNDEGSLGIGSDTLNIEEPTECDSSFDDFQGSISNIGFRKGSAHLVSYIVANDNVVYVAGLFLGSYPEFFPSNLFIPISRFASNIVTYLSLISLEDNSLHPASAMFIDNNAVLYETIGFSTRGVGTPYFGRVLGKK